MQPQALPRVTSDVGEDAWDLSPACFAVMGARGESRQLSMLLGKSCCTQWCLTPSHSGSTPFATCHRASQQCYQRWGVSPAFGPSTPPSRHQRRECTRRRLKHRNRSIYCRLARPAVLYLASNHVCGVCIGVLLTTRHGNHWSQTTDD